jgi:predicted dehydrogenase
MAKIRIGVFGAYRGMTMIHQILGSSDAELVAVCDKFQPALDHCKEVADGEGMTNVAYYTDFEDFFLHDMDAVVLANYAHQHAPYAIRLLDSGRHVMSECLTCATMKEAVELIEAVERSGKIYSYAENYCYSPVRWEMR